MNIKLNEGSEKFFKISAVEGKEEIGRCRICLIRNDLHEKPYALLEDVFVDEKHRSKGIGSLLVQEAIELARGSDCYKIIATSRFEREDVHKFYKKLGFKRWGLEFRIDL